jgi:hypothetical protein
MIDTFASICPSCPTTYISGRVEGKPKAADVAIIVADCSDDDTHSRDDTEGSSGNDSANNSDNVRFYHFFPPPFAILMSPKG